MPMVYPGMYGGFVPGPVPQLHQAPAVAVPPQPNPPPAPRAPSPAPATRPATSALGGVDGGFQPTPPQIRGVKRMLDEAAADRDTFGKYGRTAAVPTSDPTTLLRLAPLQYAQAKFAEVDRRANILERQYAADAEVVEEAAAIRRLASEGARSLAISMFATARGPELGQDEVSKAAFRALGKDIPDFSPVTGLSSTLQEELSKIEARPRAARQGRECFNCGSTGHVAATCTRPAKPRPKSKTTDDATTGSDAAHA